MFPTSASATNNYSATLQGLEISPGVVLGNRRVGTSFVGHASGQLPGLWAASFSYSPPSPGPNVVNAIQGGVWEVSVVRNGRLRGKLVGTITGGTASWNADGTVAAIAVSLKVLRGTGAYAGFKGTGAFQGTLSHLAFPPPIGGTLTLNLSN
jgi:hypothetical protein